MQTEMSRVARRRQRRLNLASPEVWGPLLLAGSSLLFGAFFQDTVRFGWLAGAAAAMLLVRLGVPFRAPQPQAAARRKRLPTAPAWEWLRGLFGAGVLGLVWWLVPPAVLAPGWAAAGLALILTGRGERQHPLRFAGTAGLLLAAFRLVTPVEPPRLAFAGGFLEGDLLRQLTAGTTVLTALVAALAYRPARGEHRVRNALAVAAHLLALWAITYEVADAIAITRGAASMGNEALWIAAAWGLYGFMLVLTAPLVTKELPWLPLGHAVYACALAFLLLGGLMAQARWADPLPRFVAYAGVPGAILLSAWVQGRRGGLTEPDRLLALATAVLGFGILSFEVLRFLEPVFTYPDEVRVTPAMLARDRNSLSLWTLGLWSVYALLLWGCGEWLNARSVRFLALVLLGSTLLYGVCWVLL